MAKGKYKEWLEPEGLLKIEGWARDGLTDKEIAYNIGITEQTLNVWKKQFPSFSESLKKGKEVVDRIVENALFERAIGGAHQVKKTFKIKETYFDEYGRKCEKEKLATAYDEVYIPGDTTAQIFWLKNRKPDKWRDKPVELPPTVYEDNLIDALKGTAAEDWKDEDESEIQI